MENTANLHRTLRNIHTWTKEYMPLVDYFRCEVRKYSLIPSERRAIIEHLDKIQSELQDKVDHIEKIRKEVHDGGNSS